MTPRPPLPAPRVLRALAAALLAACGVLAAPPPRAALAADDLEPVPPVLFFPSPDPETRKQIEAVIGGSFGDVTKAVTGREILVLRFGLWSVPPLVARVETPSDRTEAWNAALALGSLRRELGPSHLLWPAIRPLQKTVDTASADPSMRQFCALALGCFHGHDSVRRSPASREGNEEGARRAREALVEAEQGLVTALGDGRAEVAIAAALALAKTGGADVAARVRERLRTGATAAPQVEVREAQLVLAGLLGVLDPKRVEEGLHDEETRVRAAAALAVSCWAVAAALEEPPVPGGPPTSVAGTARAFEALFDFGQNTRLRLQDRDGAEITFARGMVARITGRLETWDELFELATRESTDRVTAVAAAQALLFAPAPPLSKVRERMAEHAGRHNSGRALKEPVLAGFLAAAGGDGTVEGVRACHEFLRNRGRNPTGRLEYDVRYHAALGLVRAFAAGRVAPEARAPAVEALMEAVRGHLPAGPGRTFRAVLEDLVKPAAVALAAPGGTLPASAPSLLEATVSDPDALLARDPVDVALARLDGFVRSVFHLDALKAAAKSGPDGRVPTRDDQNLRFLLGWMEEEPYFTRLDFRRDRGRLAAPSPVPGQDPGRELPRRP